MLAVFQRLAKTVLRQLGQDGLLRGTQPCRAVIERDVEVGDGQAVYTRTVATLDKALGATRNDTLSVGTIVDGIFVPAENFVIDGPPLSDDGATQRFVVRAI